MLQGCYLTISFVQPKLYMEAFEVVIKQETYRVIRNSGDNYTFSVFNYATCHVIGKNDFGVWKTVEHRFGAENLPLDEIGDAIEMHYKEYSLASIQEAG
jgi:hypothetical protein